MKINDNAIIIIELIWLASVTLIPLITWLMIVGD